MVYKSGFLRFSIVLPTLYVLLYFYGCGQHPKKLKVSIEECSGVPRALDYVQILLPGHSENVMALQEIDSNTTILGQRIQSPTRQKDQNLYLFPISMDAYSKRLFSVETPDRNKIASNLKISGQGFDISVENEHFKANFGIPRNNPEPGLFPGQLSSLFLKKQKILLERDENNIHWSPNFQKDTGDYKTIGHLNNKQTQILDNNPYRFSLKKKGHIVGNKEIGLVGKYTFYSLLPYFLYTSTIEIHDDVVLRLLRNDEITTNKTFSHVIYPNEYGKEVYIPLYDEKQMDSLSKSPLSDNLDWVGFVNMDLGFGLISIRLAYDNLNLNGGQSPLFDSQTKISLGAKEGRYWNRVLINDRITKVPKNSRYHERNAYLTIDNLTGIKEQIEMCKNSLQHPLAVAVEVE